MRANEILTEALIDVNYDVDAIYDHYFAADVAAIQAGTWDKTVIKDETDTGILVTPLARRAHQMNPCTIMINDFGSSSNWYRPQDSMINLTFNAQAIDILRMQRTMDNAMRYVGDKANQFRSEFTPATIKGSIHHELSHWIDDTLHNQHIGKLIDKAEQAGRKTILPNNSDINAHYMERSSQVHNIVQLKREYADSWDHMSFLQMIQHSPAMNSTYTRMPPRERAVWLKQLKTRLAREGLLGANMR